MSLPSTERNHFLKEIIAKDLESGKYRQHQGACPVVTRFPPEPNGYLHIGHAKSICLNFGLAKEFHGRCHLRMDDTDPSKESIEYVESIKRDVNWLGFQWDAMYYASDYFEKFYAYAVALIKAGRAYVCSLNDEEIRKTRGTVTESGQNSPYRERSVEENLDLLEQMRQGKFPDGAHTVRAKIDMANPNMKMRDPLLYRIRHAHHYHTLDAWCIYPMYDFAHPISDALEGITYSICTLEFENNRELYDWVLDACGFEKPRTQQYEFARLSLSYTVMSKRKLLALIENGLVSGWDDPRLPTLSGMRRRGVTPEALRRFCDDIGIAKANSQVEMAQLEFAIRDDLNQKAPRTLAVMNPLKVVITNYPAGEEEWLDAPLFPHDIPLEGSRKLPFSREVYIERDDFMEVPPKGYYRLAPGAKVRLRHAFIIECQDVIKNAAGEVTEIHCTYDPTTKSGLSTEVKVKGTIHWVSISHAIPVELRLYDRLFSESQPDQDTPINPDSLNVKRGFVEPYTAQNANATTRFQFERLGYFYKDLPDSTDDLLVFNRIIGLKDSWGNKK